ncbi:hypothetical protein CEXT_209931 [Caerostris extrusa]|uniref:Uncharacterized protein n=1 Tax=Caerostris extrusa TaxID=172846 RepID=A0AAV4V0E3_CAEEX|nr:hypothetical protein CEXT_209931 [Caerostris extrusa]
MRQEGKTFFFLQRMSPRMMQSVCVVDAQNKHCKAETNSSQKAEVKGFYIGQLVLVERNQTEDNGIEMAKSVEQLLFIDAATSCDLELKSKSKGTLT